MARRRFSIFRPRLPHITGIGQTTASSIGWVQGAFRRSGSRCPVQGCSGMLDIQENCDQKSGKITRVLACPDCGSSQVIDDLMQNAAANVDTIRSGEKMFFTAGVVIFVAAATITFLNHDPMTLIGGGVVAFIMVMRAFAFRYRAWQITNRKLFQDRPPVREWLQDEFRGGKR